MTKTSAQFGYTINTDRYYGSDRVNRKIYISIEDHPRSENNCFEELSVDDVKILRNMCNQILEEVRNEDERHEAAARE